MRIAFTLPLKPSCSARISVLHAAAILFTLLAAAGCFSGGLSTTRIYNEARRSAMRVTASMPGDTLLVTAFVVDEAEVAGIEYTRMAVAVPHYDYGSSGGRGAPSTPASVNLKAGKTHFAVRARVPHRDVSWPLSWFYNDWQPVQFAAEGLGGTIALAGEVLPVLLPTPDAEDWTSRVDSIVADFGVTATYRHLPRHVRAKREPVFLVVEDEYTLKSVGARVPRNLNVAPDIRASVGLNRHISEVPLRYAALWAQGPPDATSAWLEAKLRCDQADAFLNGEACPVFVAVDRRGLVAERRWDSARRLLGEAMGWDSTYCRSTTLATRIASGPGELPEDPPMGRRFTLSLSMEPNLRWRSDEPNVIGREHGTVNTSIGLRAALQVLQTVNVVASWHPGEIFGHEEAEYGAFEPDRFGAGLRYQTPLRVQLGTVGTRLEGSIEVRRLAYVAETSGYEFTASGPAVDIGIALAGRPGFWCQGRRGLVGRFGVAWRIADVGDFKTEIDGQEAVLVSTVNGKPMTYDADAFLVSIEIGCRF